MAGKGPAPKPAALRQRRNRKPGARTVVGRRVEGIPDLPARPCACGGAPVKVRRKTRGRPKKGTKPPTVTCETCQGTGYIPWHPHTIEWWRGVWESEVAEQYLPVYVYTMRVCAVIEDRLWRAVDAGEDVCDIARERRLQMAPLGLTPQDLARLGWEVEQRKPDEESEPEAQDLPDEPAIDPRKVLSGSFGG